MPDIFEKLTTNRSATCINGCISDTEGKASFLQIFGFSEMLSGLLDKYDSEHMNRVCQEIREFNQTNRVIEVECYTLNTLLEQYSIYHIDYISLDTEGGELDILKSIDYDRFDIDIIDVENNHHNFEYTEFLESKGFELIKRIGPCDELYRNVKYIKP